MRLICLAACSLAICFLNGLVTAREERGPNGPCKTCLESATRLQSASRGLLDGNSGLENLRSEACASQGIEGRWLCEQLFNRGVKDLADTLRSSPQTCLSLDLCSAETTDVSSSLERESLNCYLCEHYLVRPAQPDELEADELSLNRAKQACGELSGIAQRTCYNLTAEYGHVVLQAARAGIERTSACTRAGLCNDRSRFPVLSQALQEAARRLLTVGDDDQCNTCQLVIIEASSVLADPATQKQILEYVKQSCQDFEALEQQCEAYVDLYGPTALAMIRQYLKPELCSQLGFCTAAKLPIVATT